MAEHSSIEWTDATWNPITGCSIVSPGCTNCYAMGLAGTRLKHHPSRAGLTIDTKAGPVWNGQVRLNEEWLTQPLQWKRPRKIFVCAHGDLFAEGVPDAWIDRVFAVMALAPQHTFQVLTKRAARMRAYLLADGMPIRVQDVVDTMEPDGIYKFSDHEPWIAGEFPLPNVWLGVSAEDQRRADERVPDLLATPAAVRFVSAEPLLGPINFVLRDLPGWDEDWKLDALTGKEWANPRDDDDPPAGAARLDWIIVGGESGPKARAMDPRWEEGIRRQCEASQVAYFRKQWGEWLAWGYTLADGNRNYLSFGKDPSRYQHLDGGVIVSRVGKKAAGRLLDGVEHNGMPTLTEGVR